MRVVVRQLAYVGVLFAMVCALVLSLASAATALSPIQHDGYVTDEAGVLTAAEEAQLEQQLSELAKTDGRPELFVFIVDRFSNPMNALQWADGTALLNNFGADQYVLAIATEGRSVAISAEYGGDDIESGPLSEDRVLDIEDRLAAEYLANEEWADGIAFVAEEFNHVPAPWWVWVLAVIGIGLVVWLILRLIRFVRGRIALRQELQTLDGQRKLAAQRLVRSDEAMRTSEQELGFVVAEFGDEETTEFREVLAECRERLQRGFTLLTKLEDSEQDTLDQTRTWTNEIIAMCDTNDRALEDRKHALTSLRALMSNVGKTAARLRTAREEATALEQETRDRLFELGKRFSPAQLAGVAGNADEIARRLNDADEQIAKLDRGVRAKRSRGLTDTVHETERLLAESTALRDAVEAQAHALAIGAPTPATGAAPGSEAESPSDNNSAPRDALTQAAATVLAAEVSAQARAGQTTAFTLSRLARAQGELRTATLASDPKVRDTHAVRAQALGEQVQSLIADTKPAVPAPMSLSRGPQRKKFDDSEWGSTRASDADTGTGRGAKAFFGGIAGGGLGFFGGLNAAEGTDPIAVAALMAMVGVLIGALVGAVGGSSDGSSSSGWSGSSSRSSSSGWGGSSSRSSSRRSSSSSSRRSSSGGSRSSGRSGGRGF